MAQTLSGFTRASSLGPIADFMERQGGSVFRVLREVDLPVALLEQRDIVIPLRAQFRFLERAACLTGDPYFGARLGQVVSAKELSTFGAWVCAAETLVQAIARAQAGLSTMLQTSTAVALEQRGPTARWSVEFLDYESEGRHHNELLAISYAIDMVRTYTGKNWHPVRLMTALPANAPRAGLENIFGTNVSNGHSVTSIEFDAALLNCCRLGKSSTLENVNTYPEPEVPAQQDTLAMIASVTNLALYHGYPRIDWVASKLGMTRRSLQRLLNIHGTSFNQIAEKSLLQRAKTLLDDSTASVTEIALELGYHDPAHFTRAFRRWTGVSPSNFKSRLKIASN